MTSSSPAARKKPARFEPLVSLGGSDPSASEYIATKKPGRNQIEERRVIEHLAANFAGTIAPAPLWPKIGLRNVRVNLDMIPWSKLSPEVLHEIAERQYANAAPGPVRASDLVSVAPGKPLRRRPVRRPAGHGVARRRVFALRQILRVAFNAGRMSSDRYLECYAALRGY